MHQLPNTNAEITVDGARILVYKSPIDNTLVIDVDTSEHTIPETDEGPALRVYINEFTLYEGVKFPDEEETS